MEKYYTKLDKNPYADLSWNIPEQKQGEINVFGGNDKSFNTEIRIAESIEKNYPIKNTKLFLPDTLKNKLPQLENIFFVPSTESGSIGDSEIFTTAFNTSDFNLVLGDFSKNSITASVVSKACALTEKPTLIIRDAVDLIVSSNTEEILMNENITIFASTAQLQKLFQSVYYPKIITLSQPLMQIVESLHKFTLSYPATLIVFNNGQLLIAKNGEIVGIPLELTKYSLITLWSGEIASKIAIYNIYNPNNTLKATISAIF